MRALVYIILLISNVFYSQNMHFAYLEKNIDTLYYTKSDYINYNIPSVNDFNIKGSTFNINKDKRILLIKKHSVEHDSSDASVIFQLFSKNIETLSIKDPATQKVIFNINPKNGYKEIETILQGLDRKLLSEIKEIDFEIVKKDPDRESVCEIKNLIIGNIKIQKKNFLPNSLSGKMSGTGYDSYGLYKSYPKFDKEEDNKGTLYFRLQNNKSEYKSIDSLISIIEKNYPFDFARPLSRVAKIKADTLSGMCNYISGVDSYIRQKYNDPHFSIKMNGCKTKNKSTGVLLYRLKEGYKVSAILDDSLKNKLYLGESIVRIDGTEIQKLSSERANELLLKEPNGVSKLELKNSKGEVRTVEYTHKDSYKIPSNFVQKTEFSTINDEIVYLKIKHIDKDALYIFLENLPEIKSKKKLVIDLRNNGGGDFLIGAQILSLFIPDEFKYYQLRDKFSGKNEDVIVNKNLSDNIISNKLELRVLVNKNTSCVSELLAYNLKKYFKNTKVIGIEHTAGALATLYEVLLENNNNVKFRTNAFARSIIMLDGKSIEGKGISPDIHVNIRKIEDLQPYNDKVLITAISK